MDVQNQSKAKIGGFLFVFLTVALDMLAIGVIIPVLPKIVKEFAGGDIENAARVTGIYATGAAIGMFLSMPVIGALSDRFGRKPIFLASNFGQAIALVIGALSPNLIILFLSRLLAGVMSSSVSTAYAYIADTTEPSKRSVKFGILGVAFGLGFIIGPAMGGILGEHDLRLPFWISAFIATVNGLFCLLFVKESLALDKRRDFHWKNANPIATFAFFKENKKIEGFVLAKMFNDLAQVVFMSTFVLYADYRFGWHTQNTGAFLAATGVATMIVQGGLIKRIIKAMGEKKAMFLGLSAGVISFFIYGIAPSPLWLYISIPIGAFWGLNNAALQAFVTSKIDPHEQGRLQGSLSSLTALVGVFGPFIFSQIFAYFISPNAIFILPGAAFFFAGFLVAISLFITFKITKNEPDRVH
ncbi:MFS transporter [Pseudaquidulcibacter saccharophilus]|uniref:MFS transporter n=1 Tax=Pseudaquidulcibacter saccharophilus TaxID=2831900 RepID=UPI001EFF22FE|nr:MFS transporter [Pseudaquidulcibacter saccharophilus]